MQFRYSVGVVDIVQLCSDDNWRVFLKRFASSVQDITGQEIDVKVPGDRNSRQIVEEELEVLRLKVDELSDEVICSWIHFILTSMLKHST